MAAGVKTIAIIGAGIAGASLACFLGRDARVTLYEAESHPGYHTTGRSAAFFAETYGGPLIQPLSTASLPFFRSPPEGFARPLLTPRGCLHIARDPARLATIEAEFAGTGVAIQTTHTPPYLRDGWQGAALFEPDCQDIDVAALHQGFLAGAKRNGAILRTDSPVISLRHRNEWQVETPTGVEVVDIVAIAAGAWSDRIAALAGAAPLGLRPMLRTVSVVRVSPLPDPLLPLVIDAAGSFYFKPDGARLWLSPHDETRAEPGDVQPDELAIATAIDRFESATTFKVDRVERSWAGLRTFAPDRLPAYGYDAQVPGLFWCAGQGGFGIQTAPAAGRLAAALLLGRDPGLPGVDAALYAASRFSKDRA